MLPEVCYVLNNQSLPLLGQHSLLPWYLWFDRTVAGIVIHYFSRTKHLLLYKLCLSFGQN